jgi:hypothetical protein
MKNFLYTLPVLVSCNNSNSQSEEQNTSGVTTFVHSAEEKQSGDDPAHHTWAQRAERIELELFLSKNGRRLIVRHATRSTTFSTGTS